MSKKTKGQTEITIYPDWCKGCGICVAFCPAKVLVLTKDGKARAARPGECINCGFCERHCPDFAIVVRGKGRRRKSPECFENGLETEAGKE
ncbi:4Fe-4S ferredoxin, iron-sulpur binding domain-containing protein [Alkalidesulfovibrio alkalitolerans DSM 16529]|jgi:2-oxoglutarate ferredoxin oxidoreductase subunit delta|uniref:4Fe-4S ferredoxin, iron-sulpur binding domain-containing protein n=1 Tax=Alkalidesulfovibrio alkalitolerans DSM 16529 TaxID=1121439 RepID=S7UGQ7_9BACT|nr:4Fe-4S binding protein [Alkalidesulfovibrio alkalitolerans]EPR31423.1 4Fe-4S ferredoxin, iron-sulpur binding domain-containing protein [Alkalidesulfovibrio alkalitolerans DSM 16529]